MKAPEQLGNYQDAMSPKNKFINRISVIQALSQGRAFDVVKTPQSKEVMTNSLHFWFQNKEKKEKIELARKSSLRLSQAFSDKNSPN